MAKAGRHTKVFVTLEGETHSVKEWSIILGISEKTLRQRIKSGYSSAEILSKDTLYYKKVLQPVLQCDSANHVIARFESISEASKATGIRSSLIWKYANGCVKSHKHPYIWRLESKMIKAETVELQKLQRAICDIQDSLNKQAGNLMAPALGFESTGEFRAMTYRALSLADKSLTAIRQSIDLKLSD